MNKIEGTIVSVLLIAIFMGTVSVEGLVPSSPSPTPTSQVNSVDISVLNVGSGLTFQPGTGEIVTTGISVTTGFPEDSVNTTAAFAVLPGQRIHDGERSSRDDCLLWWNWWLQCLSGRTERTSP